MNELSLLQESVAGHVTVLWTDLTEPEALVGGEPAEERGAPR